MKSGFILDENIIELAAKVQNDKNDLDTSCATVILNIYNNCNHICCTEELLEKYRKKLKNMENRIQSSNFIAKLLVLMQTRGKIHVEKNLPKLSKLENIPDDDIFLVKLAVKSKATLVSTDSRLKLSLEKNWFDQKTQYQI